MADLPEQDELVMAVVKKIMPYGAFCVLPEYDNLESFLHISEVAPRWIKNIHEFISEGQRHVAKVHHVDLQKNQVDISLKRVSEEEKKQKLEMMRQEKRVENLLKLAIKESKSTIQLPELILLLDDSFGSAYSALEGATEDENILDKIDLPKMLKTKIVEIARKNIRKAEVRIDGILTLQCFSSNGVEVIKKILGSKKEKIDVHYFGAPRYKITVTSENYKTAEKTLSKFVEHIKTFAEKNNCETAFERSEN